MADATLDLRCRIVQTGLGLSESDAHSSKAEAAMEDRGDSKEFCAGPNELTTLLGRPMEYRTRSKANAAEIRAGCVSSDWRSLPV